METAVPHVDADPCAKSTERCDIKRALVVIPKHNLFEHQKYLQKNSSAELCGILCGLLGGEHSGGSFAVVLCQEHRS